MLTLDLEVDHIFQLISMESPQSSRNSDSGQSSGEDSSTNQEEEIEVIDC